MRRMIPALWLLVCATSATAAPIPPGPTPVAPLDFTFAFTNTANGGGAVTGIVRGLTDNAAGPALGVDILTNSDGFGLGAFVGNPSVNTWTLSGGAITRFEFSSYGTNNIAPDVTAGSLVLALSPGAFLSDSVGLSPFPGSVSEGKNAATGLTFTRVGTPPDVPPVPLPAGAWLVLGGLLAAACLRRRTT